MPAQLLGGHKPLLGLYSFGEGFGELVVVEPFAIESSFVTPVAVAVASVPVAPVAVEHAIDPSDFPERMA